VIASVAQNYESKMKRKHTGESHKGASFGSNVTRNTLVFQRPRISMRAKNRPFMQLSSMFAPLDRVARAKLFASKDLAIGTITQQVSKIQAARTRSLTKPTAADVASKPKEKAVARLSRMRIPALLHCNRRHLVKADLVPS
jgi:hypothetical protein